MTTSLKQANYLYVFDFDSLGEAYQRANNLLIQNSGLELFEIVPTHGGATVLFLSNLPQDNLNDGHLIEMENNNLLKALQSLLEPQRVESLISVEAEHGGPFLKEVSRLLGRGYKLIDMRLSRGRKFHHAFLTGSSNPLSESEGISSVKVCFIEKPTAQILSLFELS